MSEPATKKMKANKYKETEANGAVQERRFDFDGFQIKEILMNDTKSKRVFVHGNFKDCSEDAIITLEKPAFSVDSVEQIISSQTSLTEVFQNDIYSKHTAFTKPEFNSVSANVIRPASAKHIKKYTYQNVFTVQETAQDYKNITLPYLEKNSFKVEWVYNILEHKTEVERIVYEDPDPVSGFVLLPDLKWDGKDVEQLYLCAIVHNRDIKSIRDLNESHLPLLKKLLADGMDAIEKKYSVQRRELRAYFHYLPSYYHLHVHYNHIRADLGGTTADKAHLLSDVIDNIEIIASDYYQRKTFQILLTEHDPLLQLLSR